MPQQRSEAAREASRRNGARSKGPRTLTGRTRVAYNALRHGLRGRQTIEPAYLPDWLKQVERCVVHCYPQLTQRRREFLDRILGCMLLIDQADRLIVEEFGRLDAMLSGSDRELAQKFDPKRLGRLLKYRTRFRARRDLAFKRLIVGAYPPEKREPLFRFRKPPRTRKAKGKGARISAAQMAALVRDAWEQSAPASE